MRVHRAFALTLLLAALSGTAEETPQTAETCAACHEDAAGAFRSGRHGAAMKAKDPALLERSCVACHGDAKKHIDDPSTANIIRRPAPQACLGCHASSGTTPLTSPGHRRGQIACLDCHEPGHKPTKAAALLLRKSHELCGSCHQDVKNAFRLPYSHRDGTRDFDCTNCHSVHGKTRTGRLALAGGAGVCGDCHTEMSGPFVFPHAPVPGSGCATCHQPHGSTNPRMLTRRQVRDLCLECHTALPSSHDVSRARYQKCRACHTAIHGSNHEPKFFDE